MMIYEVVWDHFLQNPMQHAIKAYLEHSKTFPLFGHNMSETSCWGQVRNSSVMTTKDKETLITICN